MSLLTRSDQNVLFIQKKYLYLANHTLKSKAVSTIVVFSQSKVCSDKLYRHKFAISPTNLKLARNVNNISVKMNKLSLRGSYR